MSQAEMSRLKEEIFSLRDKLQKFHEEKEKHFKEKEDLKKEIKREINFLKGISSKKTLAQKTLSESKEKKYEYSTQLHNLITQIKELNQQKRNFFKKFNLRNSPEEIKERIDQLEFSIETQAYPFDKEKKVMEQIKKSKKIYQNALQGSHILIKINSISKQIDELRSKTQNFNKKIEVDLKEIKDYEAFKDKIKKINDLREKQHQTFQNFLNYKKEFLQTNSLLKNKLIELNNLKERINRENIHNRKQQVESIIREKSKNVEEKIKKKQKLTTEDIITFQGTMQS